MAGLQRSAVSFRRQGSSGLVWDDRFLSGELNKLDHKDEEEQQQEDQQQEQQHVKEEPRGMSISTVQRSRSNGGYRTGKVSQAIEPPSPKLSACGFCGAFGKSTGDNNGQRSKPRNKHHRSR